MSLIREILKVFIFLILIIKQSQIITIIKINHSNEATYFYQIDGPKIDFFTIF